MVFMRFINRESLFHNAAFIMVLQKTTAVLSTPIMNLALECTHVRRRSFISERAPLLIRD